MAYPDWPLVDLELACRQVQLTPVREADLAELARIQPTDLPLDPRLTMLAGLSELENRRRLVHQGYWKALGTWTAESWVLHFAVRQQGRLVGVQTLEGDDFPALRTVDSASWLARDARARGIGTAMRIAVLGLAFDHLGALVAISSAASDNAASLGVSRRIGYRDNGVGSVIEASRRVPLQHLRLPVEDWRLGAEVTVRGVGPCLPWFGLAGGDVDG